MPQEIGLETGAILKDKKASCC